MDNERKRETKENDNQRQTHKITGHLRMAYYPSQAYNYDLVIKIYTYVNVYDITQGYFLV